MNNSSVILSHSGKQHSYYVAKALVDLGYLKKFYTSSYITSPFLQRTIDHFNLSFWSRRFLRGLDGEHVNASWRYEVKELVARKLKGNNQSINDLVYDRDMGFDRKISKLLHRQKYSCFWGFQGSCLESLKVANKMQRNSVCEMTIAHLPFSQRLLQEEARLQPQWADSIDFISFPKEYERRLIEEPNEAKSVIAISQFLKMTLIDDGIAPGKIKVIPLGFDISAIRYLKDTVSLRSRPLRLLYAGRITQRKGISYLLDAMEFFDKKDVELHIIGNIYGTGEAFRERKNLFIYQPGVTQQTMFNLYANYDALVFPSLLEGFGLVTVEAMGAGLPVITTPNTNATELIDDGKNGYVVPIRNTEEIVKAIKALRNMNDEEFGALRCAARNAALRYTWDVHRNEVDKFMKSFN